MRRRACLALLTGLVFVPAAGGLTFPPPALAVLLSRHVPILILHPAERFTPVSVDGFLEDADLQQKGMNGWEAISGPLPAGGRNLRLDQRLCRAIDGPAAAVCYETAQATHGAAPVVYGKAFRRKARIDLQYWLWYPFNDYSPTVPPGDVWQVHEGDWESVSVILDLQGRPLLVSLSRHCAGARRDWARSPKRGLRPLVYVGLGSHANYFAPGSFPHDPACWPRELRDIVRALKLVDHAGQGRTVRPMLVPITAGSPTWMTFAGAWGEAGYIHFSNNDTIAYGAGPEGPAFHDQWRHPVTLELSWPRG